jgi:hypothetical protein
MSDNPEDSEYHMGEAQKHMAEAMKKKYANKFRDGGEVKNAEKKESVVVIFKNQRDFILAKREIEDNSDFIVSEISPEIRAIELIPKRMMPLKKLESDISVFLNTKRIQNYYFEIVEEFEKGGVLANKIKVNAQKFLKSAKRSVAKGIKKVEPALKKAKKSATKSKKTLAKKAKSIMDKYR